MNCKVEDETDFGQNILIEEIGDEENLFRPIDDGENVTGQIDVEALEEVTLQEMSVELPTTILRDNLNPDDDCQPESSGGIRSNHPGYIEPDSNAFILDPESRSQPLASNQSESLSSSDAPGGLCSGMPKPLQELEKSAISAFKPFENVKALNEQK